MMHHLLHGMFLHFAYPKVNGGLLNAQKTVDVTWIFSKTNTPGTLAKLVVGRLVSRSSMPLPENR